MHIWTALPQPHCKPWGKMHALGQGIWDFLNGSVPGLARALQRQEPPKAGRNDGTLKPTPRILKLF